VKDCTIADTLKSRLRLKRCCVVSTVATVQNWQGRGPFEDQHHCAWAMIGRNRRHPAALHGDGLVHLNFLDKVRLDLQAIYVYEAWLHEQDIYPPGQLTITPQDLKEETKIFCTGGAPGFLCMLSLDIGADQIQASTRH
jgi:hypothetical protein